MLASAGNADPAFSPSPINAGDHDAKLAFVVCSKDLCTCD